MNRLKEMYNSEIVEAMMKKFEYKNIMQVPKIDKIVVNMGVGEAKENANALLKIVPPLPGSCTPSTKRTLLPISFLSNFLTIPIIP